MAKKIEILLFTYIFFRENAVKKNAKKWQNPYPPYGGDKTKIDFSTPNSALTAI